MLWVEAQICTCRVVLASCMSPLLKYSSISASAWPHSGTVLIRKFTTTFVGNLGACQRLLPQMGDTCQNPFRCHVVRDHA